MLGQNAGEDQLPSVVLDLGQQGIGPIGIDLGRIIRHEIETIRDDQRTRASLLFKPYAQV